MADNMDERLRNVENVSQQLEAGIAFITDQIKVISQKLDSVSSQDEVNKIETTAIRAHERIDGLSKEFWTMHTEHRVCQQVREQTGQALEDNRRLMTDLRLEMQSINNAVKLLQSNDNDVKKFFSGRLATIVDKLLTTFLPWAVLLYLLSHKFPAVNHIPK